MSRRDTPRRRVLAALLSSTVLASLLAVLPAVSAGAAPASGQVPSFGAGIEGFASYQGQTICSPTAKVGTLELQTWLTARYAGTGSSGISRDCAVGGRSEHKEGRAFDWHVDVANPAQKAQAEAFLALLLAPDRYGNTAALARRMGLMYVIWNDRIYSSSSHFVWRPYVHPACSGAALAQCGRTLRHQDHVHVSMSWAGALGRTSFWDGTVSGEVAPPSAPVLPAVPVRPGVPTLPRVPAPIPVPRPKPVVKPIPKPVVKPTPKPVVKPAPKPVVKPKPRPAAPKPPPGAGVTPAPSPAAGPPVLDQVRTPVASVTVPATGSGVTTSFSLAAGRTYRLVATGGYAAGAGVRVADAACSWQVDGDAGWAPSAPGGDAARTLTVDGASGWTTRDGRRCDSDEHVYVWDLTPGRTGPVHLQVGASSGHAGGVLRVRVLAAGARVRDFTTALPEIAPEPMAPPGVAGGSPLAGTEVLTVGPPGGTVTDGVLVAGKAYTVEVSGTWSAGEGVEADARCSRTPGGTWRSQRSADPWHPWLDSYDLYANGDDLQPQPAACDPSHVYRYTYLPSRTGRVSFAVWDPSPGDDSGSMQVTLWPRAS